MLPDDPAKRIALLIAVQVREQIHFSLQLETRPGGEPPAHVSLAHEKAGGVEGLRQLLFPGPLVVIPCAMALRLALPAQSWRCPSLSTPALSLDAPFGGLGGKATREQVGYRITDGVGGLSEVSVTYDHHAEDFVVVLLANIALSRAGDAWLAPEGELASLVVAALFSKQEGV